MKPPLRTKSVGTKVSDAEFAVLEERARAAGLTLSEWVRDVLLSSSIEAGPEASEIVLAEVLALRTLFLNLHYRADKGAVRCSLHQRSVSPLVMAFLLVTLCLLPVWTGVQAAKTEKGKVPPRLKGAVDCLVQADFVRRYDLNYLGLKVGDWAWVRYQVGSISGVGDTPRVFNIVVYSPDGRQGMLLFADPDKNGGFNAIVNAYRLHRHGSKWSADYGNGGYVMYEAMGKFVTELSRRSRYRIQLTPGGNECKAEGAKGE